MANEIYISKLQKEQVEEALEIFKVTIPFAFEKEGLGHLTEEIQNEILAKKRLISYILNNKENEMLFYIAQLNNKVIGTISYGSSGKDIRKCTNGELEDVGELGSLYVLPEHQGQGIASMLISTLISELYRDGIERFCLDSGYGRAQRLWVKKFGEPYKIIKDYWGPGSKHMIWLCSTESFVRQID